jgi:hypothetical protein
MQKEQILKPTIVQPSFAPMGDMTKIQLDPDVLLGYKKSFTNVKTSNTVKQRNFLYDIESQAHSEKP